MSKATVRLVRPDSIFWDNEQNLTITNGEPIEVEFTTTVERACTEGRLKLVSGGESKSDEPQAPATQDPIEQTVKEDLNKKN